VTSWGLRQLAGLTKLRILGLSETAVDDSDLEWIATLPHLEELYLLETAVTDAGLAHLHGNETLRRINTLDCDGVTPEGLEKLRLSIPGIE